MTDLTKDEVVKMAREAGFSQDWQFAVPPATLSNFATICRAPLVAEVERLKKDLSTVDVILEECKMDWSGDVTQIKAAHAHGLLALQADRDDWKARALKAEQAGKYICPVRTVADLVNNLKLMDQTLPIYGAQYIEHLGKSRCIATPPTVSRERIKDSRWIGEGDTLNAAVIWTRAEQPPQPAAQEPTSAVPVVEMLVGALRELSQSDGLPRTLTQCAAAVTQADTAIAAGQKYLKESGK